jgi:hypothetical protein
MEIAALDKDSKLITARKEKLLHGNNGKTNGRSHCCVLIAIVCNSLQKLVRRLD